MPCVQVQHYMYSANLVNFLKNNSESYLHVHVVYSKISKNIQFFYFYFFFKVLIFSKGSHL